MRGIQTKSKSLVPSCRSWNALVCHLGIKSWTAIFSLEKSLTLSYRKITTTSLTPLMNWKGKSDNQFTRWTGHVFIESAGGFPLGRLEMWKTSLSSNFDHIRSDRVPVPCTPPASILQILYYMCSFNLSLQSPVQRIVLLLESIRKNMGLGALPPICFSLLHLIGHNRCYDHDPMLRNRLQTFYSDLTRSWSYKAGYIPHSIVSHMSPM